MSALFLPALLIFFTLAIPLGLVEVPDPEYIRSLIQPVVVRLALAAVFSLSYFHWAHRFRFTLYEGLQLHAYSAIITLICYGTAICLTIFTAIVLFTDLLEQF